MHMSRRRFLGTTAAAVTPLRASADAAGQFHVCPKSNAPARKLAAFRLDELTSETWDMRLTLHWKRDVDAYRWAYDHLKPALSRQAVAMLDPATAGIRDYLVEFRIPILWICSPRDASSNPQASFEEEYAFAKAILMEWPPNIPCLGWPGDGVGRETGIGEWEGVRLASECAKFEVCSAYDGYSPTVTNLSVHSGTTAVSQQKAPRPLKLDPGKAYIAFTRSDGDGWNFQRH